VTTSAAWPSAGTPPSTVFNHPFTHRTDRPLCQLAARLPASPHHRETSAKGLAASPTRFMNRVVPALSPDYAENDQRPRPQIGHVFPVRLAGRLRTTPRRFSLDSSRSGSSR